jgi:hypothetical protein
LGRTVINGRVKSLFMGIGENMLGH